MKTITLIPLSLVRPEVDDVEMDSVQESYLNGDRRASEVLEEAQRAWFNMSKFRRERERNKRYTYGYQWDDVITVDGCQMTEEEYIKKQGNVPLKNNVIRRLVRAVLGVYRSQSKEPTCVARDRDEQKLGETMSTILQCNMQLNRMNEVYARSMEEFLISGFVVHRKWFGWKNNKCDCWTEYVQPNNFFIDNNMRDPRGWDVSLVGEIHDVTFETLCSQFAKSPSEYSRLRKIYPSSVSSRWDSQSYKMFGESRLESNAFLYPLDHSLCRVIEVWRKERKPRYKCHDYNNGDIYKIDIEDYEEMVLKENESRKARGMEAGMREDDIPLIKTEWFIDDYWYYYYLSPHGDILSEGETPFAHHSHPYVFKAYPFVDGEIHSFVSDFIDQQRYINRLITLNDWIMRSSAKGLLMFPEDCLPDGMDINDIADEWSRFNGVIVIKKGARNLPQQVANNATNVGTHELLNMQLKLIEDISGVNGSLQGKPGFSGMSASLYAQQTQNATTSLLDLMDSYSMFVVDGAYKDVKNMQQYYDSKRVFNIAGKSSLQVEYDPKKIKDVEFDLSIIESTTSPAYRQLANDFLMEIWRAGQISLEQLLESGEFPFADQLIESLKAQRVEQEQAMQAQQAQGMASGEGQGLDVQNAQGQENALNAGGMPEGSAEA